MTDKDKILDKIKKIMALSSSSNEAEATLAVSAVSLLVKSHEYARAKRVASRILDHGNLPKFAADALQSLLEERQV